MDADATLAAARSALAETTGRAADLVRSITDPSVPVPNSSWTVRDTAVHLLNAPPVYVEMAMGAPSPLDTLAKDQFDLVTAQLIANISEADPRRLAAMLTDEMDRLLSATAGRSGDQKAIYHAGLEYDLARLLCVELGEVVVHGYDLATALSRPWRIDPAHALLIIHGYGPMLPACLDPRTTAAHDGTYRVDLRGGEGFTARFTGGRLALEPFDSGSTDCTISADPVAFLLVLLGRLDHWTTVALGLFEAGGRRPELALGFPDLFAFP